MSKKLIGACVAVLVSGICGDVGAGPSDSAESSGSLGTRGFERASEKAAVSDIVVKKNVELVVEFYDEHNRVSQTLKTIKIYKDNGDISPEDDRQVRFHVSKTSGVTLAITGMNGLSWDGAKDFWEITDGKNKVGLKFTAVDMREKKKKLRNSTSIEDLEPGSIKIVADVVTSETKIVDNIDVKAGMKVSIIAR